MSLQDVSSAALAVQGNMDYDDADVTYAVIDEGQILQAGSFQNLQTLVEVSSMLAAQGMHSSPGLLSLEIQDPAPRLVQTKTILPPRVTPSQPPPPRLGPTQQPPAAPRLGPVYHHPSSAPTEVLTLPPAPSGPGSSQPPCIRLAPLHPSSSSTLVSPVPPKHGQTSHIVTPVRNTTTHPAPIYPNPQDLVSSPVDKLVLEVGGGRRSRAAQVRDCHVCGERAGKHSYYGGQVCPSCRAFFRRSVQSGYNSTYFCVKEGECEVTLKTRKNCQYCRYKRCENAGMKTSWVLTEEERKVKFEGRRKPKAPPGDESGLGGGGGGGVLGGGGGEVGRLHTITQEEMVEVAQYVMVSGYWDRSKVNDMNTNLIREFIRMVAFKHSLSPTGQSELRSVIRKRVEKFATGVSELQQLNYSDRQKILSSNLSCLLELQLCSTFNPDLQWTEQLAPLLGQEETDKLDNKLRSLNVTDLDELHLSYLQFFPECQQQDTYRLLSLIIEIGSWSQDEKEYVLVSLVLLFCPDMLDLVERHKVEETQLKFAVLLQKYLNNKHRLEPQLAVSRFAAGMLLVSRCRDVGLLSPLQ